MSFFRSNIKLMSLVFLVASAIVAMQVHSGNVLDFHAKNDPIVSQQAPVGKYDDYLQFLKQYPTLGPVGDYRLGEIEIVTDPVKMAEIEKTMGRSVGIISRDRYWIWLNDAVIFPNGKAGVYGRMLWVSSLEGYAGVVVMPVLPDGRIVLNRNYRHATRSWEYELPRGARNKGEQPEDTAIRETKEETGLEIAELVLLGIIAPDTGILNTVAPVYMSKVMSRGESAQEDSEAIAGIEAFTLDELKEGFRQGYLIHIENGKEMKIPLRDSFLTFALFQASLRGY